MCTPSLRSGFQSRVDQLFMACQETDLYLANLKRIVNFANGLKINANCNIDTVINIMKKLDELYCPLLKINQLMNKAGLSNLENLDWLLSNMYYDQTSPAEMSQLSKTECEASPESLPPQISLAVEDNFFCIISHVENPNSFYIIPEHYYDIHTEMELKIKDSYSKNINLQPFQNKAKIIDGKHCYFVHKENEDNESWCRCVIVDNLKNIPNKAEIKYIDSGKKAIVDINSLYPLEKTLYEYPPMAYHSCLYLIQPLLDNNDRWTKESIKYMKDYLFCNCEACLSDILENRVLGLVVYHKDVVLNLDIVCKNLATMSNDVVPKEEILNESNEINKSFKSLNIDKKFLNENVSHDMKLVLEGSEYNDEKNVCSSYTGPSAACFKKNCTKLHIPLDKDGWTVMKKIILKIPDPVLPEVDSSLTVKISSVLNYKSFYVQIVTANNAYSQILNIKNETRQFITSIMNNPENESKLQPLKWIPALGECIAVNHFDKWQRGMVISISEPKAEVFFVDIGITLEKDLKEIRNLDPEYFQIPKQAIYCSLANVKTIVQGAEEFAKKYLDEVTRSKTLTATVVRLCVLTKRLEILLYNDNGIDIGSSLQQMGMVTLYSEAEMKTNIQQKYVPG